MKVSTPNGHFDLTNPLPDDVDLAEVAAALGKLCRFSGHTVTHYSVAEHSLRLCVAVELAGGSEAEQLQALLHDAHEAYTGDITRPMRDAIARMSMGAANIIELIEKRVQHAITLKADATDIPFPLVQELDDQFSTYERWALVNCNGDTELPAGIADCVLEAFDSEEGWPAMIAAERWLGKLVELMMPPCG
jgi:hypothetical protein